MNFLSCEYFVAIYRAGSIRKAAGELFITQQALSGQLNKLERELGIQLMLRTTPVELTEAGRQINLDWQRRCRVMEEAMLSGFNPEERRQFADYLSRAYRNLRAEREEGTE